MNCVSETRLEIEIMSKRLKRALRATSSNVMEIISRREEKVCANRCQPQVCEISLDTHALRRRVSSNSPYLVPLISCFRANERERETRSGNFSSSAFIFFWSIKKISFCFAFRDQKPSIKRFPRPRTNFSQSDLRDW